MKLRAFLMTVLCASAAFAHKPSDSYLTLDATAMRGSWDIALRDLDDAIGLDDDGNGAITWGELRAHQAPLFAYALSRLTIHSDGKACALQPAGLAVDSHTDGGYAVLTFAIGCAAPSGALAVNYSLLFDLDPTHRGLVRINSRTGVQNAVLGPDAATLEAKVAPPSVLRFLRAGAVAVFEHLYALLLLMAVLLPAVWRRRPLQEQVETVLAFAIAQSVVLVLAGAGALQAPLRWATAGLLLSLALAVVAAIFPIARRKPWVLAYAFGLASGAAFSNLFAALALSGATPAHALLGFDLGLLFAIAAISSALTLAPRALRRLQAHL